ncbi:sigma-like protein [Streptomyces asoensis]|uniref:Sigma-like protein n=1 Tax=Streptomyces asoensis TaxID=249586 RepID=A0A6M4WRQ8_9ACTN|nr:sigma-like protein [Streptomyces asoensis]QJT02371.1 sigma-like protein [Streptomyces asoensis]
MSSTEKQSTDITTLENHSPVPPALKDTVTQKTTTQETTASTTSTDEEITTLENHSPVPPALDLDGK